MTEPPNYPDGPDFLYAEDVRTTVELEHNRTAPDLQSEVTPSTRTRGADNL
jgi:hypothetical protein